MSISKTGCSESITKVDLENKYKKGFADGLKTACELILEELKDQRFEIIDDKHEDCKVALKTVNKSIQSVQDRLNKYDMDREERENEKFN